jgi:hypothetical protein
MNDVLLLLDVLHLGARHVHGGVVHPHLVAADYGGGQALHETDDNQGEQEDGDYGLYQGEPALAFHLDHLPRLGILDYIILFYIYQYF